jgi:ankyrin repeat protein
MKNCISSRDFLCNLIHQNGDSALHHAAYEGQTEICRLLLADGADPHTKNNVGYLL